MSILIDADTTFIVQGITGREAVNLTRECLDYGTARRSSAASPPAARAATSTACPCSTPSPRRSSTTAAPIDGSVVTVPPAFTKDAVFEAIENGVKLIVIVTERIPRGDVAQMVELATERGARIIGPNCLGIIVPDVIKMGGIGGPAKDAAKSYAPGPVGVISRSGGMTTEISSSLTAAGLGSPTAVSIGGDAIIGSTYAELMPYSRPTQQTQAIVIYTEPGGRMEAQLAALGRPTTTAACRSSPSWPAGSWSEMPGMSFGHAGTIVEGKEDTATEKIARLEAAGIGVAEEIDRDPRAWSRRGSERRDERRAIFIAVEVDEPAASDPALAAKLAEVCPVDIFKATETGVEIVEENLDECVLCELCIDAAPAGTVRVIKLYER